MNIELKIILPFSELDYEIDRVRRHKPKHEIRIIIYKEQTRIYYFISKNKKGLFFIIVGNANSYKEINSSMLTKKLGFITDLSFKTRKEALHYTAKLNHELSLEFINQNL